MKKTDKLIAVLPIKNKLNLIRLKTIWMQN